MSKVRLILAVKTGCSDRDAVTVLTSNSDKFEVPAETLVPDGLSVKWDNFIEYPYSCYFPFAGTFHRK